MKGQELRWNYMRVSRGKTFWFVKHLWTEHLLFCRKEATPCEGGTLGYFSPFLGCHSLFNNKSIIFSYSGFWIPNIFWNISKEVWEYVFLHIPVRPWRKWNEVEQCLVTKWSKTCALINKMFYDERHVQWHIDQHNHYVYHSH